MSETVRFALTDGFGAVARARRQLERFIGQHVGELPEDIASELAILITELASNAVAHGQAPIDMTIRLDGDRLRIEAKDHGPDLDLVNHRAGRFGLHLIERLSDHWGCEADGRGKIVWAEKRLPLAR